MLNTRSFNLKERVFNMIAFAFKGCHPSNSNIDNSTVYGDVRKGIGLAVVLNG